MNDPHAHGLNNLTQVKSESEIAHKHNINIIKFII